MLIAENAGTDRVFLTAALQDRGRAIVIGETNDFDTPCGSVTDSEAVEWLQSSLSPLAPAERIVALDVLPPRATDKCRASRITNCLADLSISLKLTF